MSDEQDRAARAGDYVLGLMDDAERAQAQRDLLAGGRFAEAARLFSERMGELDRTARPEPVPATLWSRIERRIADVGQDAPVASPVAAAGRRAVPRGSRAWASRAPALRRLALAASVVAALGIGYVGGLLTAAAPRPVVLVVLQTPENRPGAVFEAYADNSVRIVPLEDFAVPDGKIMQVWTLYDQAVGPVSLGTLASSRITLLGGHSWPRPAETQLYEITLEPKPGSPTGKPTGPILVKGFAKRPVG